MIIVSESKTRYSGYIIKSMIHISVVVHERDRNGGTEMGTLKSSWRAAVSQGWKLQQSHMDDRGVHKWL